MKRHLWKINVKNRKLNFNKMKTVLYVSKNIYSVHFENLVS